MEGGGGTFPEPRTRGKTSLSSFSTRQEGLRPKHRPFGHGHASLPNLRKLPPTILPSFGRKSEAFPLWPDCSSGPSATPF